MDLDTIIDDLCAVDCSRFDRQRIDAAITALRAVEWRPIAEAPKDKPILGKFSETHIEGIEWAGDDDGYWCFLSDGDRTRQEKQPVEFMPLPAARASKEG